MSACSSCKHDWLPWVLSLGRYRCSKCSALGYAGSKSYGFHGQHATYSGPIVAYICHFFKKKCRSIATEFDGEHMYCAKHISSTIETRETRETRVYYCLVAQEEERARRINEETGKRLRQAREEIRNGTSR